MNVETDGGERICEDGSGCMGGRAEGSTAEGE